jgi:hypothetical protein
MTKINSATLTNFCNKYRIKVIQQQPAHRSRYLLDSSQLVNYGTSRVAASDYHHQIEEYQQYTLELEEKMLYRLLEQDAQIEEEDRMCMHYPTVRAAYEQYQMTLDLCRSYNV